jgi:hypothetical protein
MLRAILAVVLGYIAMFIVTMITFTAVQFSLGTDQIFRPASYEVTTTFIAFALILSFIAAVLGGAVAALIARSHRPVVVLACIVLALGFVSAAVQLAAPDPGARTGDVTPFEAASQARQPAWYALIIPFIGAAGVFVGGRFRPVRSKG